MQAASEGWYVSGCCVQGARWDHASGTIVPPEPHDTLTTLPVLLIRADPLSETDASLSSGTGIHVFDTLERKRVLGSIVIPPVQEHMDRSAPSGPSPQWTLRVAAFFVDPEVV